MMFTFTSLLAATTVALTFLGPARSSPVEHKIAITKWMGSHQKPYNLVQIDKARIERMRAGPASSFPHDKAAAFAAKAPSLRPRAGSIPAMNALDTYTAQVKIGGQGPYTLLIDTGSSNTWTGANTSNPYNGKSCDDIFFVSYGSGEVFGLECTDTVTLSSSLVIKNQGVGSAEYAEGFTGVDGILGVGPVDLTSGTTLSSTVPTVSDNLYEQGTISTEVLGIFYAPISAANSGGELTFGGTDSSKYSGAISYTPVTSTSPASSYWGINQTVSYGGTTILANTAGIVDTGTTLLYLATDAFDKYQSATGAVLDPTTGLLAIKPSQYSSLLPLTLNVLDAGSYTLTPNAQIWPRSLNADIGGNSSFVYLIVNNAGTISGSGLDFIDGYVFLERFYSVFDTTNKRVGFAPTAYTNATSN